MKKQFILLLLMILTRFSVHGQDILFLYNGEKIEAKVTEVSETEVRYKKWSNLSGPTWVKNITEIERIKYQKDRMLKQATFVQGQQWDFRSCDSSQKPKQKKGKCISGNKIVEQIDLFYSNGSWDRMLAYIKDLPSCISRDCIHQYYHEQFLHSCDEENEDDIIRYGTTYLKAGGTDELPTVLPIVAKVHAAHSNEIEVENLINEFTQYSKVNDDLFEDDILQLKKETYELLHPYKFEDETKGKWVVLEERRGPYDKNNPFILEFDDLSRDDGIKFIPNTYNGKSNKHSNKWQIGLKDPINFSQGIIFDAPNQLLITRFASEQIKDRSGNEDFARTGIEDTRNMRANLIGTIYSSNASFEDKLLYSGVTVLASSLIEELFKSSTISSKSVEAYTFAIMPRTQVTLDAAFSYISGENVNGVTVKKEETLNQRALLVKWEESDSVYFVSNYNSEPITLAPIDKKDPLLWEYNQIQKRKRTAHLIGGLSYGVSASVLTGLGVNSLVKYCNHNGNRHLIAACVELGTAFLLVIPYSLITSHFDDIAKDDYSKINMKNREKLIRKAERAEKKLTIGPCYNPENNGIGASVNLNF